MSPVADVRQPGEGGSYQDRKGNFTVTYKEIAAETMKPKSADSPFRESLRVVFTIEGNQTISLSVTIEEPAPDLWGFVPDPESAPTNEAQLRAFIEANIVRDPVDVYASGFIQSRIAPEGTHTFTKIVRIYQYTNKAGDHKLGMVASTEDGLTASWNCPEPKFDKVQGETPDGDRIGPLSPDVYAFQYLQMFGLDWKRMEAEDLANAKAYWPGHYDASGKLITPLFPDLANPWPGFLAMIDQHGRKSVKLEIENDKQYGLGPKRLSKGLVKMVEVDASTNVEFDRELAYFYEQWDNLAKVVLAKDDARFVAGGKLTDDGKAVAVGILKPLVQAHPHLLKSPQMVDGKPVVTFPPTSKSWHLDGLVAVNFAAEKLMKLGPDEMFTVVNLTDPVSLLAWAAANVPELSATPMEGEVAL